MTLQELYLEIEGNYKDMIERFGTEERVSKFVLLFLKDNSYDMFLQAMEEKNVQDAFRAIHTLKGVCLNLGLQGMSQIVNDITELLREGNVEESADRISELKVIYEKHIMAIQNYGRERKA